MTKILVVDDVADIREIVTIMLESTYEVTVREARTGNQAIQMLRDDPDYACVICDYNMPEGTGEDVARFLLEAKLSIPFILCSSSRPSDYAFFKQHPPYGFVVKPELFPAVTDLVLPVLQPSHAPDYVRVRTTTVLKHGLLSCDLYVKLNEKKYVKVMRQGDQFDNADFAKFESKHIEFLYTKTSDAKHVLERMISGLSVLATTNPPADLEQGFKISAAAMEVITDFNRTLGFTPEVQLLTKESIQLAIQTIRKNPKLSQLYSQLLVDPNSYLASHSTVLAYLSCGLASLMQWTSDLTFYKLSLAAFLHDLPLDEDLSKIDTLQELELEGNRFNPEQRKRYQEHPSLAGALANSIADLSSDVSTIIVQHHERPDGTGFPNGINHEHIQPLAALLIIGEGLISFRHKISTEENLALFLTSVDPSFKRGVFRSIVEAIHHAMPEKQRAH